MTYEDVLAARDSLVSTTRVPTAPFLLVSEDTFKKFVHMAKFLPHGSKIVSRVGRGKKYRIKYTIVELTYKEGRLYAYGIPIYTTSTYEEV